MNYKVLVDKEKFKEFLEWLPELKDNEKFYGCLFARKKYVPELPWIKSDKSQLKRFLTDKDRFEFKVRQLHCEVGSFVVGDENMPAPQEALALYVAPNPRDMVKATWGTLDKTVKLLMAQANNYNIHQEAMSEVQRSAASGRPFVMFDLDWKDEDRLQNCLDIVDGLCDVVETKGGYHLFVLSKYTDRINNKMWYKELSKHADVCGDNMTPVVGCYQGGFVPYFKYRHGQ